MDGNVSKRLNSNFQISDDLLQTTFIMITSGQNIIIRKIGKPVTNAPHGSLNRVLSNYRGYGSGPLISSCFRYRDSFAHECAKHRFGVLGWANLFSRVSPLSKVKQIVLYYSRKIVSPHYKSKDQVPSVQTQNGSKIKCCIEFWIGFGNVLDSYRICFGQVMDWY